MSTGRRAYTSALRDAQAEQTRERVLRAAAAEFTARGYAGTTIASIAAASGVAPGTVKLNGAKHELLLAAFELVFSGRESREQIMNEEEMRARLASTPESAWPELFAGLAAELNSRAAVLWNVVTSAATGDAAVRAALDDLLARRRADFALVVAAFDERGLIREGRDRDELAALFSFIASPEGYLQLVRESGLGEERYRAWLAETVRQLVLGA